MRSRLGWGRPERTQPSQPSDPTPVSLDDVTDYVAPLADLAFVLEHIVNYRELASLPGFEHADLDTAVGVLEECGRFMAEVVGPLNRVGDTEGSRWQPDGTVTAEFIWQWMPNEIAKSFRGGEIKSRFEGERDATATLMWDGSAWTVLRITKQAA